MLESVRHGLERSFEGCLGDARAGQNFEAADHAALRAALLSHRLSSKGIDGLITLTRTRARALRSKTLRNGSLQAVHEAARGC